MILTLILLIISILRFKMAFIKYSIASLIPFYCLRDEILNIVKIINFKVKFINIPISYPSYLFVVCSYLLFAIVTTWFIYFLRRIYVVFQQ